MKGIFHLVCVMLHGNITFSSSNIPKFDLPVSTGTGKDIPAPSPSVLLSLTSRRSKKGTRHNTIQQT